MVAPRLYCTVKEAAEMLSLSESTVWRRIKDGSFPKYQPGGRGTAMRLPIEALTMKKQQPVPEPKETTPPPTKGPAPRKGPRPRWKHIRDIANQN